MKKLFATSLIMLSCTNTSNACEDAPQESTQIEIGYGLPRMPEGVSIVGQFHLSETETERKRLAYTVWLETATSVFRGFLQKTLSMGTNELDLPSEGQVLHLLNKCSCSIELLIIDVFLNTTKLLDPSDRFVFMLHPMNEEAILLNICYIIEFAGKVKQNQWKKLTLTIQEFISTPQEMPKTPLLSTRISRSPITRQDKPVGLLTPISGIDDDSFKIQISQTPEGADEEDEEDEEAEE